MCMYTYKYMHIHFGKHLKVTCRYDTSLTSIQQIFHKVYLVKAMVFLVVRYGCVSQSQSPT